MLIAMTGIGTPGDLRLAHDLLARGHGVRAALAGPDAERAVRARLPSWAMPRLTAAHLDPGVDAGWTRALRGAEAVIHSADRDPAITRRILRAARDAGAPRIHVSGPLAAPRGDAARIGAMRAARDFAADQGIALTLFRTGLLAGPPLGAPTGFMRLLDRLLRRRRLVLPALDLPVLDIRDLAAAHLAALQGTRSIGHGVLLVAGTLPARGLPDILRRESGRRMIGALPWPRGLARLDPVLGPYAAPPPDDVAGAMAPSCPLISPEDAVRATIRAAAQA